MAEGGKEDLADSDAASIHSDTSTEILYCAEDSGIPVVDLVTPSTSPSSSVPFLSPASSIYSPVSSNCSDLADSDVESVGDLTPMEELDYFLSIASPLNESVEDNIMYPVISPSTSLSSSCTGSELSFEGTAVSEYVNVTHVSDSSLCSDSD
jgi:hypothetical protein